MVLSNADKTDDNFTDEVPSSDGDPYSNSDAAPSAVVHIDLDKLPKPVPFFGVVTGITPTNIAKAIHFRVQNVSKELDRPLTEEEAMATAYWTARQFSIISYGTPCGIAAGAWRTYMTAGTFRFPFYQPDLQTFRPDVWPSTRLKVFGAPLATTAWHASRFAAYGIIGSFIGQILFASYSMSVATVGELSDPRLKEYVKVLRTKARQGKGRVPNQPRQPGMVDGVQQKDASELWKDYRREIGDDASPTSGTYGDTDDSTGPAFNKAGSTAAQENNSEPTSRQMPTRRANPMDGYTPAPHDDKQPDSLEGALGDASPTGGKGVLGDTGSAGGSEGGSAWARIRQQASSQPKENNQGPSWPTDQRQQPVAARPNAWARNTAARPDEESSPDSFSYSKYEEDKQLAREEAQKEFDARVERERRGGDFTSESAGQKRW